MQACMYTCMCECINLWYDMVSFGKITTGFSVLSYIKYFPLLYYDTMIESIIIMLSKTLTIISLLLSLLITVLIITDL